MLRLAPLRPGEDHPLIPGFPAFPYWRRLFEGTSIALEPRAEFLSIGTMRCGSLYVESILRFVEEAPTAELRAYAELALKSIERCQGVVFMVRSIQDVETAVVRLEELEADFRLLGRDLRALPVVVQATWQDHPGAHSPAVIAEALRIEPRFSFGSVPTQGLGIREPLEALIREIHARAVLGGSPT